MLSVFVETVIQKKKKRKAFIWRKKKKNCNSLYYDFCFDQFNVPLQKNKNLTDHKIEL